MLLLIFTPQKTDEQAPSQLEIVTPVASKESSRRIFPIGKFLNVLLYLVLLKLEFFIYLYFCYTFIYRRLKVLEKTLLLQLK